MAITNNSRSSATLRIYSEHTTADEITNTLKYEPSKVLVKGTEVVPGHPKTYVIPRNVWMLKSELDASQPLDAHIASLIEFVEKNIPALNEVLKTCEIDIFCGFSSVNGQGGF